jgi:hypothetical protein
MTHCPAQAKPKPTRAIGPTWPRSEAQPRAQADSLRQPSLGRSRRWWHHAFRGQAASASAGGLALRWTQIERLEESNND